MRTIRVMSDQETIEAYTNLYLKSLTDEVQFAKHILHFQPYPYQEKFLRDRAPLIAACCGRQVGKTTLAAIKALHHALAKKSVRVLIVSAGLRQSMILFDRILTFIDEAIPATALLTYKTRTNVRFATGSEIVALPCGREGTTLRGYTADMVILDETNFIPKTVIDSVIRPTTITKPDARLIMLSTPWTRDHPFYDALTKPELGFKTYTWPSSMNPLITKEKLELERRTIGEFDFNREYNAQFIDDQFSYFPSKLILTCTDTYPLNDQSHLSYTQKGEYYVGIDFGKHADHSAIAIVEEQKDHTLRLVYLQEFELETTYTTVIATTRTLQAAYQFRGGQLDQTGVGEAPYEEIREFAPTIRGITLTARVKEDILGKLRLKMEHHEITLPSEAQRLLTQLTQQRCEPTPSGNLKFTHPQGTHDDLAWAFALAVHAYHGPLDWMTTCIGVHRQD
jgi:phage FluMu gp28-like protein